MDSSKVKQAVKTYKLLPHSKIILSNDELLSCQINRRFREEYYGSFPHIQNSEMVVFENVNNHKVNIDNAFAPIFSYSCAFKIGLKSSAIIPALGDAFLISAIIDCF